VPRELGVVDSTGKEISNGGYMLRLVVPVENMESMEKARAGLVFRTDLPYRKPNGIIGYRKGWVLPKDSQALDRSKKKGDPEGAIGTYKYEADMFDDSEGESWAPGPAAKKKTSGGATVKAKSKVADRIPKPEEAPDDDKPSASVSSDLEKPIAKMKFRDYGSWSASGKHLSQEKRSKLNQEIAELLNRPADSLDEKEIETIRQYSGFGGVKAEDERGVLYDYYTSPPVARMVWRLASKISPVKTGAKVLEPSCGAGVFFDVAPDGVDLTGVEYDARTSAVARLLQPKARVYHSSFEQFNLHQSEKYDVVIGNAPFGDRSISTSFLDQPDEKSLDRYFISRSLDNLKGGGAMAIIVAPGVMDNVSNKEWRETMMRKGQFVGAVRLPNQSFKHTHTGVSPDVVMFRAYPEDIRSRLSVMSKQEMADLGFWDDDWVNGTYYDQLPAHRLGRVERGQFDSEVTVGKLEPETMDAACDMFEPRELKTKEDFDRVREVAGNRQAYKHEDGSEVKLSEGEASAVAAKTLRVGMTKTVDGKVYRLNANHRWELVKGVDEELAGKIDRIKEISETVRAIREAMRADEPVDDLQRQARALIEAYERDFGAFHYDDADIKRFIKANPAIANVYEAISIKADSDLLTKQNVYDKEIDIVDGHRPAIRALMEMQRDMADGSEDAIRARYPNDADGLIKAMWEDPDVFIDESEVFLLREDMISGSAWDKIDALEKAIAEHEGDEWEQHRKKWKDGAEALRDAVGWIPIEDADVFPQASWIPEDLINQWAEAGMKKGAPDGYYYGKNEDGKWGIISEEDISSYDWRKRRRTESFAGEWSDHNDEFIYFLNNQKQRSKYTDTETYNKNALENFKAWLATSDEARAEIEELFNRKFNTELGVPTKTYAVTIDGWSEKRVIKPWQWQSIHQLYREGKGISALGTGYGKTDAAIALMALLRQEGKVKRPLFQVPNNKVKDWVRHINEDMPGLKVGSVDPERDGYGNRDKRYQWYQELASGDYDVLILPESSASEIQLEAQNDEMIVADIASQFTSNKGGTDRKKEEAKASAEGKLSGGKKNLTITFEELGCDALFVDEFHNYKNLFTSSLSRETGMNDGRRSDRALSMFKKMEYMRRNHDGKNVFGLTATPLTNSPLEYYNMMQHIAPERLKEMSIANIDDFIHNFADIEEGQKYDAFSGQLKSGKVLVGFKNLRALQDMFFKYTDLQNDPTKIGLKKPTPTNRPNILPMQDDQTTVIRDLAAEIEKYRQMSKEEKEGVNENFLTFYSRMRTASLDLELYDPEKYKGWKNPKIEKMAESAMETFKTRGGGQVVFCDRVMSGDASFNMHDKIKAALVAKGFKESEIVVVNGVTKAGGKASDQALEKQVSAAIDGYNSGKYKVIIGTTQTIGEGVNLQKNSSALHHLDIPYRPSDFIQRNGRIDRQGNQQSNVELHTYATAGTIDNYSMALVAGKENWINQLLKTKSNVFTNPDGDGMDMDEILLSLTEEWGNKDDADAKRQAIAGKKAAAIQAENEKKASDYLKQLSLMRGAIAGYKGEKGSRDYQNRLRKIDNLESALRNNPEFRNPEILGESATPFMYDESRKRVIKPGDLIVRGTQVMKVGTRFDYKKRQFEVVEPYSNKPVGTQDAFSSSSVSRWSGGESKEVYLPNPTEEDIRKYYALSDRSVFHQQPESFKAENYNQFMENHASGYGSRKPPFIMDDEDGGVKVTTWRSGDEPLINPYTKEGKEKILNALKNESLGMHHYEDLETEYGSLGGEAIIHERKIKAFEDRTPYNKQAQKLLETKYSGQQMIKVERLAEELKVDEYDLYYELKKHPDYEADMARGPDGEYGYYITRKSGLEKSIKAPKLYIRKEDAGCTTQTKTLTLWKLV